LSGAGQGFFFSFLSLVSLLPLADFGLSYAALQTAGRLAGSARLGELPAVGRRVLLWNVAVCLAVGAVVAALGWGTFSAAERGAPAPSVAWQGPWLAHVLTAVWGQLLAPALALREGSGRVTEAWRVRLVQEWSAGVVCLAVLAAGGGLWSLPAFAAARAAVATVWFLAADPLQLGGTGPSFPMKRWMAEIWPFQWRVGVSGLCGFLIFRAFPPLILLEKGPVAAGQFGLAFALMNLLIAVTTAWPMSRTAHFAALFGAGRHEELRREFPVLMAASTALSAAAAAAAALALGLLSVGGFALATRLTDPLTTTLLLVAAVVHHAVGCVGVLLRAEGKEPLLGISILGAVLNPVAVWLAARYGPPPAVAVAFLSCTVFGLVIALRILRVRWAELRR
jgi:Na+-driven multidrug efflux pump